MKGLLEQANQSVVDAVDPDVILGKATDLARTAASAATIEGEIAAEKIGNIFDRYYGSFVDKTVDGINKVIDKVQTANRPITGVNPYQGPYQGHGGGNDFMKYVYTEKPVWFTKKDMIWN
jgi:hypothetical protein